MSKIVKGYELPLTTYDLSEKDHKDVLKGASIEVAWGDDKIVLEKLVCGWEHSKLTTKTNAIKKKLKISEVPVAYQIQKFDFRIIPLYRILDEEKK